MLELRHVSKSYAGRQVLAPTNLRIETGRVFVIIGPSGCGKSTLLRLMIGLIQPDSGSVWFQQTQISGDVILTLRQKMGYVIQDGGLFPHLTAERNVSIMARHLGWNDDRISHRINELAEMTHFPMDALDRYPVQISGGQRQRVGLMRALMLDPDVLLLDEPLGALDPMIRSELQDELHEIFLSLGKTVVLVTHDMGEAAFLGDSILLLCDGKIVQQGTLQELVNAPTNPFVTQFVNAQRGPLEGNRT